MTNSKILTGQTLFSYEVYQNLHNKNIVILPSLTKRKNGSNKVDVFGSIEPNTSTLFDPFLLIIMDGVFVVTWLRPNNTGFLLK
jgi:hypothetical protein